MEAAVRILAALFLLLHVLVALVPGWPAWGLDSLRYYPGWVMVLCAAAALPLLVPRWGLTGGRLVARLFRDLDPWAGDRRSWLARGALLTGFLVLFMILSSAVHLLGDGYLYVQMLERQLGAEVAPGHEPLAHALARWIGTAGGGVGLAGAGAYRWLSILSGLLYVGAAIGCARWAGRERELRGLLLGLLLTAGLLQVFCGYVETYAPALALLLLFLALALRSLETGRTPWLPAAVLGLAVATHFAMAVFLPSLVVLGASRNGSRGAGGLADALLPAAGAAGLALAVALSLGWDPPAYLGNLRGSHLLSLAGAGDRFQPYGLVSVAHLNDLLNQMLLTAPAAVLALPVLARGGPPRTPRGRFLLIACAVPLLAVLLLNPEIGAFRDWDVLALSAVPLVLATGLALHRRRASGSAWRRAGWAIVWAAGWHTVLWIGVNARTGSALARYEDNLRHGALSRHARAYGWESLGRYHEAERVGDPARALAAYELALAADDRNPRVWNLAGLAAARAGDAQRAVRFLEQAVAREPGDETRALNNLAIILSDLDRTDEAIAALRRAVRLRPQDAELHHNLGLLLARQGQPEEAVDELRAASRRGATPDVAQDLALALYQLGRPDEALAVLDAAAAAHPEVESLAVALGRLLAATGRVPEAVGVFRRALDRSPDSGELHLQLGVALGLLGETAAAAPHLRRALELRPDHPQAAQIRALLQQP